MMCNDHYIRDKIDIFFKLLRFARHVRICHAYFEEQDSEISFFVAEAFR